MTDKPLRICHFLNYCREGGTVGMILSLMARSKHEHTYVTFEASKARREQFQASGLKLVELGEDIEVAVDYMKVNADIVHAQNSGGPEPGVHIGVTAGKPTVETCQSPSPSSGHLHDNVYVVPVSRGILDYWPKDIRVAEVIYSCAEPVEQFARRDAKNYFALDPDRITIGRLGRLEGLKRPQDFLAIAHVINQRLDNVQFLLAGDGNDGEGIRSMTQSMVEESGISMNLPGFLTGRAKNMAYSAMDILLYPTSMEGFGIVFAEAMSIGLPIVTYSDPVNIDIVGAAGVFGIDNAFSESVSHPFSGMAQLVIDILQNHREYDKLSARSQRLYDERFRPEIMTRAYDRLYEKIYKENLDG